MADEDYKRIAYRHSQRLQQIGNEYMSPRRITGV